MSHINKISPLRYDCLKDLNLSEPVPFPINDASLTEEPAFPQNADPVAFGGKNDVFDLGTSYNTIHNELTFGQDYERTNFCILTLVNSLREEKVRRS